MREFPQNLRRDHTRAVVRAISSSGLTPYECGVSSANVTSVLHHPLLLSFAESQGNSLFSDCSGSALPSQGWACGRGLPGGCYPSLPSSAAPETDCRSGISCGVDFLDDGARGTCGQFLEGGGRNSRLDSCFSRVLGFPQLLKWGMSITLCNLKRVTTEPPALWRKTPL